MSPNSKYKYLILSFTGSFLICFAAIITDNINNAKPLIYSVTQPYNIIIPFSFGLIIAYFGYLYWKRKNSQFTEVQKLTDNLHSLLDVNKALSSTLELDKVLQIIVDESTRLINLDTGAIYLHDEEKLYLGATTPPLPAEFPEVLRYDLLKNHPHIQNALIKNETVVMPDTSKAELSESEKKVIEIRKLKSILFIPLIIEERPVGTLILGTVNNLRIFSEKEIEIFYTYSGQAALSIEKARLYKKSLQIASELKQQNEEFYRLNDELNENNTRIQKINQDLQLAKEKSEESDRLKSDFLQNMSHEVRTPLNSIAGFSQLLCKVNLPYDKIKKYAELILASTRNLTDIIDDVIEISQIQSKTSVLNYTEFDFIASFQQIVEKYKVRSAQKNIDFIVTITNSEDLKTILSDKAKIIKIINHVLDNAVKFTVNGFVKVQLTIQENEIIFEVMDTGIGISEDKQKVIFEPFRQIESGICRNYGGNGLGLTLTKSYLEMLGGTIELISEPQKGTFIKIFIPFKQVDLQQQTFPTPSRPTKLSNLKILIVEDDHANFTYLEELLSETGALIMHASDGQKAIDICRETADLGLVLMDIKTPILDGYSATKLIKEFRPQLPIIAQTAYTQINEIENPMKSSFDGYLFKPIVKKDLLQVINKYFGSNTG
ncbi:MAG: ATP-binding protein [Bacteroidales bacterium]